VDNFQKAAKDTLRYLFAEYLKGPAVLYTINSISKKNHVSAVDVSDYLLALDFIRERWIYPDGVVACKITIRGIEEIDPVYVREKLRQLIGGLAESGGSKELLEILTLKLEEYSVALDLVKQLEGMGFIKIRHTQGNIVVELTEEAKKRYQKGNNSFFSLMSY
jgi:hypothetical protein